MRLVIAKLLLPEEFGLIGMAVVFTGLVNTISELGMGAALIQRKNSDLGEQHFNTVFWISTVFGFCTFLIMFFLVAPIAANFYNEPLLKQVIWVLSIPMFLNPLTLIHRVKLNRAVNFKPIAISGIAGSLVSGVCSIIMALLGFGVWSVAFQGVISTLITVPFMWLAVKWIPQKSFSWSAFKDVFSFGFFVLIKNITIFFVGNVDYLIIGKMMGSYYVGIYSFAFILTDIFRSQLMAILNKVMFPVYSGVQSTPETAGRYYLKIVRYNTLFIYPIMIGMFIYAAPFTNIFFGEKWAESVVPLQILSIAVMFHLASGSLSTVLTGVGKAKTDFYIYLLKTFVITVPALLILIRIWGINGAAIATLASKILSFIINNMVAKKYIYVGNGNIIKTISPAVLGSLAMIGLSFLLMNLFDTPRNIWSLVMYAIISLIIYSSVVFPFVKKEIIVMWKSRKIA